MAVRFVVRGGNGKIDGLLVAHVLLLLQLVEANGPQSLMTPTMIHVELGGLTMTTRISISSRAGRMAGFVLSFQVDAVAASKKM